MPKGPQGQKRPANVVGNAVHVMRIATGEETEDLQSVEAIERGRLGGLVGGKVRAARLDAQARSEIAAKAAKARWDKPR